MTGDAVAPAPKKLVVGLTGGIGCGKSTVLSLGDVRCPEETVSTMKHLGSLGCSCSDDDAIVHALYAPGGAAVAPLLERFPAAAAEGGGISREALSEALRSSPDPAASLKELEAIVHPLVFQQRQLFIESARSWLVVVDSPLLLETMRARGWRKEDLGLDAIIVVTCAPQAQRRRCLARPGMTEGKLDFLLSQQLAPAERQAYADFLVDSSPGELGLQASLSAARAQAAGVVQQLLDRHGGPWPIASARLPRPSERIECVTFDLDDTLFPTKASLRQALTAFRAEVARRMPRLWQHYKQGASFGEAMQDEFRAVAGEHPRLRHDFSQLRQLALERLVERFGEAEVDPKEIAEHAMAAFLAGRGAVDQHLFDDVLPTLTELKRRGLCLGSVTNGNADLSAHAPGLSQLLDFQISAAGAGAAKPRGAPFLAAANAAGLWPCQILHVGDSLADDVVGARQMGMKAVHLRRGGTQLSAQATAAAPSAPSAPHAAVASLAELPSLLARWAEVQSRL
ncbi:coaE [Symbiodinium natans]|uniref:CoaE protein n=1 Tax=Symbiodinium natans TaxID=878477 RepID=A0A812MSW6_9DINO|nr:coaE [Symbiodinium natans]